MQPNDLKQVSILAGQLGYPDTEDRLKERFNLIQQNQMSILFVAENEMGQILGFVQVNKEAQSLVSDVRAEISALVVDESHRSLRIGASLVSAAEDWAKEKKLTLIRVRSNVTREKAHQFYLREGYRIKKSWHLFTKNLGD